MKYILYIMKCYLLRTFIVGRGRIQFLDFFQPILPTKPLSVPNNWWCSVSRFTKAWITAWQWSFTKKSLQIEIFILHCHLYQKLILKLVLTIECTALISSGSIMHDPTSVRCAVYTGHSCVSSNGMGNENCGFNFILFFFFGSRKFMFKLYKQEYKIL